MNRTHHIARPARHALIVGAGLAGCALAESFSRRGWQVTVLDAGDRVGGAVAALPLIAQHPAISPDFDRRSRLLVEALTRHAALRAGPANDIAPAFEICGRLQPMALTLARRCAAHVPPSVARAVASIREARDPQAAHTPAGAKAARSGTARTGDATDDPATLPSAPEADAAPTQSPLAPAQATRKDGMDGHGRFSTPDSHASRSAGSGLWFPGVAALSPARWWAQVLLRHNIRLRLNAPVARIDTLRPTPDTDARMHPPPAALAQGTTHPAPDSHEITAHRAPPSDGSPADSSTACPERQVPPRWQAFSADGSLIAEADVLILACQADAFRLAGIQEDDHGRLRFAPARVWVSRADTACHSPNQGSCPAGASNRQLQSNTLAEQTDSPIDSTAASCDHGMFEALPPADQTRPEPPGAMPAPEAIDLAHADPGSPPLCPIQSEHGLCLERPGRFWMHNDEYHRHWQAAHTESQHQATAGHVHEERKSRRAADGNGNADDGMAPVCIDGRQWHPSVQGERLQLRDNLPMIGLAPDLDRIRVCADDLARNDRRPIPRRAGLYLLTGLAGRGSLYAPIGAEMIAAHACHEQPPVDAELQTATDPARFIKRRLQRVWSRRGMPKAESG